MGLPYENREKCDVCGSLNRTYKVELHDTVDMTGSVNRTIERGLNELRLAVLGILAGIGISVAFGVGGDWWRELAAGVGAVVIAGALIRIKRSRNKLMSLMHWLSGG
jgi:hypothetical protein